ncbi:MAG: TIGR04290 family methyltransferase [Balneolaceae bacterium]
MDSQIEELAPWFHNIHLPDGSETAPDHFLGDFPAFKWAEIKNHIPADMSGKTVLDVGCNAGFYTIELARRGASVTAIDLDPHYLRQAEWVADIWELQENIEFKQLQVYDLAKSDEKFDIVWFMGVFYHLRYPLLALDILSEKSNEMLVFQTLTMPGKETFDTEKNYNINDRQKMEENGWPKMAFIEHQLNNDPTNWWAPNISGIKAMLRSAGMKITANPGHELFICEPDAEHPGANQLWNKSEYLSATGKEWKSSYQDKVDGK